MPKTDRILSEAEKKALEEEELEEEEEIEESELTDEQVAQNIEIWKIMQEKKCTREEAKNIYAMRKNFEAKMASIPEPTIEESEKEELQERKEKILETIEQKLNEDDKQKENFEETLKAQYQKALQDKILQIEESNKKILKVVEFHNLLQLDLVKLFDPIAETLEMLKSGKCNRMELTFSMSKDGKFILEKASALKFADNSDLEEKVKKKLAENQKDERA